MKYLAELEEKQREREHHFEERMMGMFMTFMQQTIGMLSGPASSIPSGPGFDRSQASPYMHPPPTYYTPNPSCQNRQSSLPPCYSDN